MNSPVVTWDLRFACVSLIISRYSEEITREWIRKESGEKAISVFQYLDS